VFAGEPPASRSGASGRRARGLRADTPGRCSEEIELLRDGSPTASPTAITSRSATPFPRPRRSTRCRCLRRRRRSPVSTVNDLLCIRRFRREKSDRKSRTRARRCGNGLYRRTSDVRCASSAAITGSRPEVSRRRSSRRTRAPGRPPAAGPGRGGCRPCRVPDVVLRVDRSFGGGSEQAPGREGVRAIDERVDAGLAGWAATAGASARASCVRDVSSSTAEGCGCPAGEGRAARHEDGETRDPHRCSIHLGSRSWTSPLAGSPAISAGGWAPARGRRDCGRSEASAERQVQVDPLDQAARQRPREARAGG